MHVLRAGFRSAHCVVRSRSRSTLDLTVLDSHCRKLSSFGAADQHMFGGNWWHPRTVRKACADGKEEQPQRHARDIEDARVLIFNEKLEILMTSNDGVKSLVHDNVFFSQHTPPSSADPTPSLTSLFLGACPDGREYIAVQLDCSNAETDEEEATLRIATLLQRGGEGTRSGSFVPMRTAAIKLTSSSSSSSSDVNGRDTTTGRDLALAGQARNVLMWHASARFCGHCGHPTAPAQDAWKRVCLSETCRKEHFPRTDVVAITAISSPDGEHCLLGRQKAWPPGLYSCLAGFLEPGESLSEGVAREVFEESGVCLDKVEMHSTQPWPCGPSPQLMMGCISRAESMAVAVNQDELDDARWFSRDEVTAALDRCQTEEGMREYLKIRAGADHERQYVTTANNSKQEASEVDLLVPPPTAIAHHLIRAWASRT